MINRRSLLDKLELLTDKMVVFVGNGAAAMIERKSDVTEKLKKKTKRKNLGE